MFTEVAEHVEQIRRHLLELRREVKSQTVHGGADCSLVKALMFFSSHPFMHIFYGQRLRSNHSCFFHF
jgi:di/tripeptidase